MRYSQLSIDEAQALSIYSKYSKVSIGKVSSVVSVSKYDVPYSIGTINNLKVNSSYSTFQIDKLNRKLMAIMRYSECKVTQVSNQFSLLELDLQYGGAQIPIPYELSYTIEATAQYGEIQIPDATRVRTTQSNTSQNFQGVVGSASGTNCNVRIESRYSNIDLESN
jgi:hypothetical protein